MIIDVARITTAVGDLRLHRSVVLLAHWQPQAFLHHQLLVLHSQILDRIAHSLVDLPRQGRRSVPPRRLLSQQVHIDLIFHDRADALRLREHMLISGEKIRILRVVNCSVLNAADGPP